MAPLGPAVALLLIPSMLLAGCAGGARRGGADEQRVGIDIELSRFRPDAVEVRRGVPVRFVITNTDPIDHEFIAGDPALHARHENGTEPSHGDRPGEVSLPIGTTRSTVLTFDRAGEVVFACHLPGHLAYGMRGVIRVR